MKTMELGVCSTFFLKQIHGGAAGVGCVWRKKFGVELFFLDLELRGALPNTPSVCSFDIAIPIDYH
jgi:hypothetical protein